jgi:hypothetical protein
LQACNRLPKYVAGEIQSLPRTACEPGTSAFKPNLCKWTQR